MVSLGAVLIALTELIKDLAPAKYRKYSPLLAVALGVVLTCYSAGAYDSATVVAGLVLGLTATGGYKAMDKLLS